MIHGAGGGGWEFDAWRGTFEAADYPVLTPDMLPSAAGLAATRFQDYLDQLLDLGLERPILVGASMGAMLALKLAETVNPAALVIINREPTDQDELADLVIHGEIGQVLSQAIPG